MNSTTDAVASACAFLNEHYDRAVPLAELAEHVGLSSFHLQRTFRNTMGVTPRQYQEARRVEAFKKGLRSGADVTTATYDAGFGSSSRVYERSDTRLGMTPGEYRRGAKGVAISYASADTPLGSLLIGATDRGLCFVQFDATVEDLQREFPAAELTPASEPYPPEFGEWMQALREYLIGQTSGTLRLPVDVRATAFQMAVWQYLQTIPAGQTRSYAEVADALGKPTAARAVARACATNRVALAIPCHRVIRGSGELGGYRWGLTRKQQLLARERGST